MFLLYGYRLLRSFALLIPVFTISSCNNSNDAEDYNADKEHRVFSTSFEEIKDFANFYIVPPGDHGSDHSLSDDRVYSGNYSHKAVIVVPNDSDNDSQDYKPHRAYPTVQFQKTEEGVFQTPVLVTLWVWLDINLEFRDGIDDWFSFATLSPDTSDEWSRTVVVNLTTDGFVRLVHIPNQGEQIHLFQMDSAGENVSFPLKTWTRLDVFIDFSKSNGYAKVWQNGALVSHALVNGGNGSLAQAHLMI
jgi:hypothetical protein